MLDTLVLRPEILLDGFFFERLFTEPSSE